MNAGTLTLVYVFAKVGIFFQINAIITKKSSDFTEVLKNFTYFCNSNAEKSVLFDIQTLIRGACP